MIDEEGKKYHFTAHVSSEGTLGLQINFPDDLSLENKEIVLADSIAQAEEYMINQNYITLDSKLMSPSDVAKEFGKTRQYWEKLIKEKKIHYKQTSAGMITTDLWVQGYLNRKEAVDEYVKNETQAVKKIKESDKQNGRITCPHCMENMFDFNKNSNNINGLCRAGCGFRINTVN